MFTATTRRIALAMILAVFASTISLTNLNAAIKSGSQCSKKGSVQISGAKKYTCVAKGRKLVWNSGTSISVSKPSPSFSPSPSASPTATPNQTISSVASAAATPSPTPTPTPTVAENQIFKSICEPDNKVASQWFDLSKRSANENLCVGPFTFPETKKITTSPSTPLNFNLQNIEACKIKQSFPRTSTLGFPSNQQEIEFTAKTRHPSADTVYQVIPIYTNDIPDSGTNPNVDYGKYFQFLKEFSAQASDNGSNVVIKVPDHYIKVSLDVSDYGLRHEMPRDIAEKFNVELSKQIDPIIDFTGVNVALIVFPLKTNTLVKEQIGFGTLKSNESTVWASIMSGNQLGSGGNFALPMWWIHELNHLAIGFGDTVQDKIDSPAWWGINNWASAMDELVWYKWLVGFVSDNQINCLNSSNSSTVWVTPSTIKGSTIKAAVVPLSPTKVIVIESQRAQGINYKLPEISEGALIYFVDLNMVNPHDGIRLILPKNKIMITGDSMNPKYPGINANAVLKLNEYSEHAGYRFTVIESGDFGDVIKVEKL